MPPHGPPTLAFDRGTLILRAAQTWEPTRLPGFVWDERVGAWRAPAFRLGEIQEALAAQGLETAGPELCQPPAAHPWKRLDLRPYQKAALAAWTLRGYRGVVVLPTGGGKTRVALAAAALLGRRTLCLVPTRVLLAQWLAELRQVYEGPLGVYGEGEKRLAPVTVATFASALRSMADIGRQFDLVIVDEVHHFGDALKDEVLEMSTAPWRLGLTATPPLGPALRQRLDELVGPLVFERQIGDLLGSYLAPFTSFSWMLPLTPDERRIYDRDMRVFRRFTRALHRPNVPPSWPEIVRAARQSPEGEAALTAYHRCRDLVALTQGKAAAVGELLVRHRTSRCLIFTADTPSAYRLSRRYLIPALTADIKRAEREKVLAAFQRGELSAVLSCRVLNEGMDVPAADVAIILGGRNGGREHVQRIGRVLRPLVQKVATVYELVAEGTFEVRQAQRRKEALGIGKNRDATPENNPCVGQRRAPDAL